MQAMKLEHLPTATMPVIRIWQMPRTARQNATSVSRAGGRGHTDVLLPRVRRRLERAS